MTLQTAHSSLYCLKDGCNGVMNIAFCNIYDKIDSEEQENFQLMLTSSEGKLEIKTIDQLMYAYTMQYIRENNLNLKVKAKSPMMHNFMGQAIIVNARFYHDVRIMDIRNSQFFIDEIDWIRACNYMELSEYQNADRIGRTSNNNEGPQKLQKNSRMREAIWNVMQTYRMLLKSDGIIDFKEANLIALKQAQNRVRTKYTHIIIDESQDLSRVQLEFIKLLHFDCHYSSIEFIFDTAQSIYMHSWLKGRSFKSIGYDMTGKSTSLSKGYRTTAQILKAAYSLIENDANIVNDENFVKPNLIDKQGCYPIYTNFHNENDEADFVVNEINKLAAEDHQYKNIVIIAKNKNELSCVHNKLKIA